MEAQKLSIRQRELKLEELKSAEQRLQMLLSTNEEDVDPEVWIVMKEQKKKLQQFIFTFEASCTVLLHVRESAVETCCDNLS